MRPQASFHGCLWLLSAAICGAAVPYESLDGLPPLIPLTKLVDAAAYSDPKMSPDGRYISYLKPLNTTGFLNVFVKQLPPPGEPLAWDQLPETQITYSMLHPVQQYSWSKDGKDILFMQDNAGGEIFHLLAAPAALMLSAKPADKAKVAGLLQRRVAPASDLTPFPGVKASGVVASTRFPRKVYVGLNKRDPSVFDMYSTDLDTGHLTLDTVNPGNVVAWAFDYNFEIRAAVRTAPDGSTYIVVKDSSNTAGSQPSGAAQKAAAAAAAGGAVGSHSKPPPPPAPAEGSIPLKQLFTSGKTYTKQQWIDSSSTGSDVAAWRELLRWPLTEQGRLLQFNKAGDGLYILTSVDRDTTELQLVSTAPGAKVLAHIASSPLVDVQDVLFDEDTWEPQLAAFEYLEPSTLVLNPSLKPDWDRVVAAGAYQKYPTLVSASQDKQALVLLYKTDNASSMYQVFYRQQSGPPQLLFEVTPQLKPYTLAKVHGVVLQARDGLALPSYLTMPVQQGVPEQLPADMAHTKAPSLSGTGSSDVQSRPAKSSGALGALAGSAGSSGSGRQAGGSTPSATPQLNLQLPLVLLVHGGPYTARDWWVRGDSWPVTQLLANRGYAVLRVNFRGSLGFGKRFQNLGDNQWGRNMQNDLTDAVKWAISSGVADPKRVCIMGASYGGYAALAGVAFTPELYRCGIDLSGISDLASWMAEIPPWWGPERAQLLLRMGDVVHNQTLNRMISPIYHVRSIRAPLLMGQGANDVRVATSQADLMFAALKQHHLNATYALYQGEGHILSRAVNNLDWYSRVDQLLANALGGRSEPPYYNTAARPARFKSSEEVQESP